MTVKRVGLVGSPISQSLSPAIHNQVYERLDLPYHYELFDVKEEKLPELVQQLRDGELFGLNVTIPYKEQILALVDRVGRYSKAVGASSLLMPDNGVVALTVDTLGIERSLNDFFPEGLEGAAAAVHGAGGAARAVGWALLRSGVKQLKIFNRTPERGLRVARTLQLYFPDAVIEAFQDRMEEIANQTNDLDIWVSAVPPGTPILPTLGKFNWNKPTFIDLDYRSSRPPLVEWAEDSGYRAVNGLPSLIYQALESIRLWCHVDIDVVEMKKTIVLP